MIFRFCEFSHSYYTIIKSDIFFLRKLGIFQKIGYKREIFLERLEKLIIAKTKKLIKIRLD